MGYGAYMNIINNLNVAVMSYVSNTQCMYDNGDEGSNLSYFNNLPISANSTSPGGEGQYIEAKGSGDCFFNASTFTITINDESSGAIIGTASFSDSNKEWEVTSCSSTLNAHVINSDEQAGDQASITLSVISAS